MRIETKAQIAKSSLSLLIGVAAVFFLGVIVIVLCVGLQINPFKETTSTLLTAGFIGLIGVAAVLVLVNVATNLSLIADAKISELKIEPGQAVLKKFVVVFFIVAAVLVGVVFAGTYLSKERYLGVIRAQADDVLKENGNLLAEIGRRLSSGKSDDFQRVGQIRTFLESQRSGLPSLTVIFAGKFEGRLALYKIDSALPYDEQGKEYEPPYFACTQNLDCEYLMTFFSGGKVDALQKYTVRDEQFYIYIPYVGKDSRFVLLFNRMNSYGKLGS